jgi:hypothetical protein
MLNFGGDGSVSMLGINAASLEALISRKDALGDASSAASRLSRSIRAIRWLDNSCQRAPVPNRTGCGDVVDRVTLTLTSGSLRALLLYLDEHDTSVLA